MLLKIPLFFSSHSKQKQYSFIPSRIHAHNFSCKVCNLSFPLLNWNSKFQPGFPEKVVMLNIRQFIPSDGLLSLFTSLFFLYMKAAVKGTSTHLPPASKKTWVSSWETSLAAQALRRLILGLCLKELDMSLVLDTNQNAFRYSLNGCKTCQVCVLRTAVQGHPGEEERTGIVIKDL